MSLKQRLKKLETQLQPKQTKTIVVMRNRFYLGSLREFLTSREEERTEFSIEELRELSRHHNLIITGFVNDEVNELLKSLDSRNVAFDFERLEPIEDIGEYIRARL